MYRVRKQFLVLATISFLIISNAGFACKVNNDKARTLAKAADDSAQAQISITNLIKTARDAGWVSDNFAKEAKVILQDINKLNDQVISLAKTLATESTIPPEAQGDVLKLLGQISTQVQNLNNMGLLHIKNEQTKLAFSGFVLALQSAITTVVIVFNKN